MTHDKRAQDQTQAGILLYFSSRSDFFFFTAGTVLWKVQHKDHLDDTGSCEASRSLGCYGVSDPHDVITSTWVQRETEECVGAKYLIFNAG